MCYILPERRSWYIYIYNAVLSKAESNTILESLVWIDMRLNTGLPDHWWPLYSRSQWLEHHNVNSKDRVNNFTATLITIATEEILKRQTVNKRCKPRFENIVRMQLDLSKRPYGNSITSLLRTTRLNSNIPSNTISKTIKKVNGKIVEKNM